MSILSNRINNLSESETLAMAKKSRELKAQGFNVINLSIGEPDFYTPDPVKEAAINAINNNETFYPPVAGYLDLREAICRKFKRDNNLSYTPDQIVVSAGAKQSIANAVLCLVNPGEEIIIPSPYWVSYKEIAKLAEAKAVYITAGIENDFKVTPQQVENAITNKTKAFLFSSPCNPTGSVYTKEELKGLADVFAKYPNVIIISDEIYEYINFSGQHESIAQFDNIKDRVVTINGVSKGFAMTGWRIGYMAAPLEIAKACEKLQGQITSGACSIAQRAALKAVTMDTETTKVMLKAFKERRDVILELIKEIPGVKANTPSGAFYVFFDVTQFMGKSDGTTTINSAFDLSMYLLNTVHVALVSGEAFGDPTCLRISYATSKELLIEAMQRIKVAFAKLK